MIFYYLIGFGSKWQRSNGKRPVLQSIVLQAKGIPIIFDEKEKTLIRELEVEYCLSKTDSRMAACRLIYRAVYINEIQVLPTAIRHSPAIEKETE